MTAARKRPHEDNEPEGGSNTAAAASHTEAAVSSSAAQPAASSAHSAVAASTSAPLSVDNSGEDDSESECSSSDDEQSELVVIRLPASLVHQMRDSGGGAGRHVTIQALDSAHPFLDAPYYTAPAAAGAPPPSLHRFVGSYEYSVGTQLLWKIREDDDSAAASASADSSRRPSPLPMLVVPQPPQIELLGKTWKRLVFARQR